MQLRPMLVCSLLFSAIAIGLLPYSATGQTPGHERPGSAVIVELFTSEGCSSCPPADAVLRQIDLKQTRAGQLIVGISEHVTYWNNLGWTDPFSSAEFTERQDVYASRMSPEGPYTPQMVVNGREQFVGGDIGALQRALGDEARRPHRESQHTIHDTLILGTGCDVFYRGGDVEAARYRRSFDRRCRPIQRAARRKRRQTSSARLSGALAGTCRDH